MARIWVLRQADPPQGNLEAASPIVFANGAPLVDSKEGTVFFTISRRAPTSWLSRPLERLPS